jgi:hypothetical protein
LEISEDGAKSGEQAEKENPDESKLLVIADVQFQQNGDRKNGDDDVGHDGYDSVCRERGPCRQACPCFKGIPRFVDLGTKRHSQSLLCPATGEQGRIPYRITCENQ